MTSRGILYFSSSFVVSKTSNFYEVYVISSTIMVVKVLYRVIRIFRNNHKKRLSTFESKSNFDMGGEINRTITCLQFS